MWSILKETVAIHGLGPPVWRLIQSMAAFTSMVARKPRVRGSVRMNWIHLSVAVDDQRRYVVGVLLVEIDERRWGGLAGFARRLHPATGQTLQSGRVAHRIISREFHAACRLRDVACPGVGTLMCSVGDGSACVLVRWQPWPDQSSITIDRRRQTAGPPVKIVETDGSRRKPSPASLFSGPPRWNLPTRALS